MEITHAILSLFLYRPFIAATSLKLIAQVAASMSGIFESTAPPLRQALNGGMFLQQLIHRFVQICGHVSQSHIINVVCLTIKRHRSGNA